LYRRLWCLTIRATVTSVGVFVRFRDVDSFIDISQTVFCTILSSPAVYLNLVLNRCYASIPASRFHSTILILLDRSINACLPR
jgi:hypothetical protein